MKSRKPILEVVASVVELKQVGKNYTGDCPFCGDKKDNFTVSPGRNFFHCFKCNASGQMNGIYERNILG